MTSGQNDCAEVSAAIALAISIAIDPQAALRPPIPASSSAIASAPPPVMAEPRMVYVAVPVPALREQSDPIQMRVGTAIVLSFGTAPAAAVGAAVFGGGQWKHVSVDLEGRADLPASARRDDGAQVRSSLLLASIVPCLREGIARLCVVGGVGAMQGSGVGLATPGSTTTFYAAAGARAALEAGIVGPLYFRAYGDLLGTLTRTRLRLDDKDVWTTPPLSVSLGIGLSGKF
jgi:hypothetical protein